ncbi:MAG: phospholipase D family protein [Verrucomicrobia bacterium]|nr:phospholipase D family protein [Verrucomicrobiota bacterium]
MRENGKVGRARRARRGARSASALPRYLMSRRGEFRYLLIFALALRLSSVSFGIDAAQSGLDTIVMRDGRLILGQVVREQAGGYSLHTAPTATAPATAQLIPKQQVKFVLYADPRKADSILGIARDRRLAESRTPTVVTVLPTHAFARAIFESAQAAQTSIWITAYYISGGRAPSIKGFYDILRQKAREGVDVVIVSEFGPGTSAFIRNEVMNFAHDLMRDGIQVLFIQEHRVLHKKLIIVDGQKVILGSSNLTTAGTSSSSEMNVEVSDPVFVDSAVEDFHRIRKRARPAEELKY